MKPETSTAGIAPAKKSAQTRELPVMRLLAPHSIECCETYLLDRDGAGLSAVLAEERAKLVIEFSRHEVLQAAISDADRRRAAEMMRDCLDEIEARVSGRRPGGLDFMPAAEKLLSAMPPRSAVLALDLVQNRLGPVLSRQQSALFHAAIRDVRRSIDRFEVSIVLRDSESIVSRALTNSGLQERADSEALAAELAGWLSGWAAPLLRQDYALDFDFFRGLLYRIDSLNSMTAEEWRGLARQLVFSIEEQLPGHLDDGTFELFRTLARCGHRIPLISNLKSAHARTLRLLDDELVDWILVLTLVGESRSQLVRFLRGLEPDRFSSAIDFEPEELREFFDSLLNRIRPEHERYELDWLQDVAERVCRLFEDARILAAWKLAAEEESANLASTIAAESSERLPTEDAFRTLQQLVQVIARAVITSDQSTDAESIFRGYMALMTDSSSERPIWRNAQRIAAQLSRIDRPLGGTIGARLQAVLRTLSELKRSPESDRTEFREIWKAVSLGCTSLAGEFIHGSLGSEFSMSGSRLVRYASTDIVAGRMTQDSVLAFLESGIIELLASSSGVDHKTATSVIEEARSELTVFSLWAISSELSERIAGTDEIARRRFRRIITLFARMPGNSIPRVEEEWQIWIGPEIHWLLDNEFAARSDHWNELQEGINSPLSSEKRRGITQFFRSILGYNHSGGDLSQEPSSPFDRPLSSIRFEHSDELSEPFNFAVQNLKTRLEATYEIDWLSAFFEAVQSTGDLAAKGQDVLAELDKAVGERGLSSVMDEFDRVENALVSDLDVAGAAVWLQVFEEKRSAAQRIAMTRSWVVDAGVLARRACKAATLEPAASENESAALIESLIAAVRHMGVQLSSLPPSLAAIELPRYWLANVLPVTGNDPEFPSRFFAALAFETRDRAPDECRTALSEWAAYLGQVTSRLHGFEPFSRQILQCKEHLFTEDKSSESDWRSFLGGLITVAVTGADWPGGRPELSQALVNASPSVSSLTAADWKASSTLLIKRLRDMVCETDLPDLIGSQTEIGKILMKHRQLDALDSVDSDIRFWCLHSELRGMRSLWQHFVISSGRTFGLAHPSFIDVSQLNDWPLPDETTAKAKSTRLRAAFQSSANADPNAIRVGLLKRSGPKLDDRMQSSARAAARYYALAMARADSYAQRKAIVQLCERSMSDRNFDELQRFAGMVDATILEQSSTQREAAQKRFDAVAQGWMAANLSGEGATWVEEINDRGGWSSRLSRNETETAPSLEGLLLIQVLAWLAMLGRIDSSDVNVEFGRVRLPTTVSSTTGQRLLKMLRSHLPKPVHIHCEPVAAGLLSSQDGDRKHA